MLTSESEHDGFAAPDYRREIDLEAQIRLLPPRATCKGVFFAEVLSRGEKAVSAAELFARAGLAEKKYSAFLDHPHAEWMRLTYAVASVIPEGARHVGEGLRHLGRHAFDAMFNHPLGKVIFGPLGLTVEKVVANGPLAYRVGLGFGSVAATRLDGRRYRYAFRGFPSFLETFNVGVLEGGIARYHAAPRIRVRMAGLADCDMDVSWS